ncbi:hypothetical protein SAMN04487899_10171 [Segatella bryantii]|nr:hypothetical protein SAMN04487899_10171 [Segatella bryantii]
MSKKVAFCLYFLGNFKNINIFALNKKTKYLPRENSKFIYL